MPDNKIQLPKGFTLDSDVSSNDIKLPQGFTLDSDVKKKEPTSSISLDGQSALEKGKGLSNNSFLAQVGKQTAADQGNMVATPIGMSELPIGKQAATEITLKEKAPKKEYYNAPLEKGLIFTDKTKEISNPEILSKDSFKKPIEVDLKKQGKDYIEKIREQPIEPVKEEMPEGQWSNIAQNFADKMVETVSGIGEAGALWLRNAVHGTEWGDEQAPVEMPNIFEKGGEKKFKESLDSHQWLNDPLGKVALGLNGIKQVSQQDVKYNELPNTGMGQFIQGAVSMAPDIMLSEIAPEAAATKAVGLVEKVGKLLVNNFTKYLTVKEAAKGYTEALESGKKEEEAVGEMFKGGLSGLGNGMLYAAGGVGGNAMTNSAMKELTKAGVIGAKGIAAREAINYLADYTMYGLAVPLVQSGVQGKLPNFDEMIKGGNMTLLFGLKRSLGIIQHNAELNKALSETMNPNAKLIKQAFESNTETQKALAQIKAIQQGTNVINFINADPSSIVDVYNGKKTAEQLKVEALAAAKKARDATDMTEKQKYVGEAMTLTKAANVKEVTTMLLENNNFRKVIENSDLPDNIKQAFLEKADAVHNELHPDQIKMREHADQINIHNDNIEKLNEQLSQTKDPIEISRIQNQIKISEGEVENNKTELDKLTEKELKDKQEAENQPNVIFKDEPVTVKLLSSEEPPVNEEGVVIATLSGKTEEERQNAIKERQKETKVTDAVVDKNNLVQATKEFFKKGKNYAKSSEGLKELNSLRTRARDLGLEIHDGTQSVIRRAGARKTKIKYDAKAEGDRAIDQSGKLLTERNRKLQELFEQFNDRNILLDVKRSDGVRMTDAQLEGTIQDILDGIPSRRATEYLDAMEAAIESDTFPLHDKGMGEFALTLDEMNQIEGITKENAGEPMDEQSVLDWLNDEAHLTPEQEAELTDNIENLLYEYEPETAAESEIFETEAEPKKGVPSEAEQITTTESKESVKPTTKPTVEPITKPIESTEEVKTTGVKEEVKPAEVKAETPTEAKLTIEEEYKELPKSNNARKNAIEKLINNNFEGIVNELIKNKKIEKKC